MAVDQELVAEITRVVNAGSPSRMEIPIVVLLTCGVAVLMWTGLTVTQNQVSLARIDEAVSMLKKDVDRFKTAGDRFHVDSLRAQSK